MKTNRRTFLATSGAALVASSLSRAAEMDIFEAAATGNQDRVKELVKQVPGIVNQRAGNGRTPLYFAAEAGQPEMVMLLAVGMTQPTDLSGGSESPLIAIADYRDPAIARDMAMPLLNNGSNPNVSRKDGATALHLAAARGNIDVARLLIHRGAVVDPKDDVVMKAVPNIESIDRVYFGARYAQNLKGSRPERDDKGLPQGEVNEFIALAHTPDERVRQMHKGSPALLSTRATWDESPIEAAAHMGLEPLAQYFAEVGAAISTCTAVVLGQTEMVRKMIREDPNRLRERGAHDFALLSYTAFGSEREDLAGMLLEAGAKPNAFGFGQTPLHVAAGKGYLEVAALLIEHGADVNATPRSRKGPGPTPLAVATQRKQSKMVDFLISRGAKA